MSFCEKWTEIKIQRKHFRGYECDVVGGENVAGGHTWKWTITKFLEGKPCVMGYAPTEHEAKAQAIDAARKRAKADK